jgi:uncharacterized membrane protein YdjX (TVP38/TMEM64 family)
MSSPVWCRIGGALTSDVPQRNLEKLSGRAREHTGGEGRIGAMNRDTARRTPAIDRPHAPARPPTWRERLQGWGRRPSTWVIIAVVVAAGLTALVFMPEIARLAVPATRWLRPEHLSREMRALISRGGTWAPLVSVLLMIIHTVVPVPIEFLAAANGAAFGMWEGSLITWGGAMLSAALGFQLARWLGRPRVERFVPKRKLNRVDTLIRREGWEVALALRFIPIPGDIISIALGLTTLPWPTYLWTTAVAIIPWTLASVAAGVGAVETRAILPWALGGLAVLNVAGFIVEAVIQRHMPRSE